MVCHNVLAWAFEPEPKTTSSSKNEAKTDPSQLKLDFVLIEIGSLTDPSSAAFVSISSLAQKWYNFIEMCLVWPMAVAQVAEQLLVNRVRILLLFSLNPTTFLNIVNEQLNIV